jgi:ferredoxin-NADP reductase
VATRVYHSQILRIDEIAPATRVLRLERPPEFEFSPGQFISCLLEIGGDNLTKPYTITSDPETAGYLDICLNQIAGGLASTYLFQLQVGASLRFTGPWGTFTLLRAPERESVFIGADT